MKDNQDTPAKGDLGESFAGLGTYHTFLSLPKTSLNLRHALMPLVLGL